MPRIPREAFRSRVRMLHARRDGAAYSKQWLAQQLGIDRSTLRDYLANYDVGWPPFRNEDLRPAHAGEQQEALWRDGRCVWVNPARALALGLSHPNEAIGLTVAQLNGRPSTPPMERLARAVREGSVPSALTATWYIHRVTGEQHWVTMLSVRDVVDDVPMLHTYCWPMLAPDIGPRVLREARPEGAAPHPLVLRDEVERLKLEHERARQLQQK